MESVAFFLPTRKGSQRVKNKNTREFAGIAGGLVENKIAQLLQTKKIDEIILSTNDEECATIAQKIGGNDSRLRIVERPTELCTDATNLQDLIAYVPTITKANHIIWGHVTTPIVDANDYDEGLNTYFAQLQNGYDSLVGVTELKNFLLNKDGKIINNTTPIPWPRTQDLETLFEINHTMFIASRTIYERDKNRLGSKPFLYEMSKITSLDIDWEDDFAIAESVFKKLHSK